MIHRHRVRTAVAVIALGAFVLVYSGCGLFSRSRPKPPETSEPAGPGPSPATPEASAPAPSPAPPPVLTTPPAPPAAAPVPPPAAAPRRPADNRIADEELLKGLVQGKTTKGEVRELFGIPQEVVLAPGLETFIYYRDRTSGWFSRTTERVEMLTVRFDGRGLLKDFEYRYSGR